MQNTTFKAFARVRNKALAITVKALFFSAIRTFVIVK